MLAGAPRIKLPDEPTTCLLQKLKAQGKMLIMVLHDLEQALKYSDQIIAIATSQKIFTGTPNEILSEEGIPCGCTA